MRYDMDEGGLIPSVPAHGRIRSIPRLRECYVTKYDDKGNLVFHAWGLYASCLGDFRRIKRDPRIVRAE